MDSVAITKRIRSFIAADYLLGQDTDSLGDHDSFLEGGILDSTGVLQLIKFVEDTFDIRVEDDEVTTENLDSIHKTADFIQRKLSAKPSVVAEEAQTVISGVNS